MKQLDKMWVGIVEDNIDPDRIGRVKVRVQSLFDELLIEDIPWANQMKSIGGCSYEIPSIGKIVTVYFPNNNLYEPYYVYSEHYNVNLKKKLSDLSDEEYRNFMAITFDHKTKIYSDDNNLTIDYLYNKITIDNDNINLELKDNNRKVNIGCKTAGQQAVLGNHFFNWFDKFINKLVEPTSIMGNSGSPVLKPEIDLLLVEYQTIRETFLSDHVYIVDDMSVDKLDMDYNSPITDDGAKINDSSIAGYTGNDPNLIELSSKIKDQKNKELDKLKESVPSEVTKKIRFVDLPENDNDNTDNIGDINEYYKIKN